MSEEAEQLLKDGELLAVAIEALTEISGLGAEPSSGIARAALDEIEERQEAGAGEA